MNEMISKEIDALIDKIEGRGGGWFVLAGSTEAVGPTLVFELPKFECAEAVYAAMTFQRRFKSSLQIRKATIDFAMAVGCLYFEMGNEARFLHYGESAQ